MADNGIPPEDEEKYVISRYVIGSLYVSMSFSVLLFLLLPLLSKKAKVWQKLFYFFVFFGTLWRGASFLLLPAVLQEKVELKNYVNVFFNTYPSILMFSAYFVILFLWIEIFHFTTAEAKGNSIRQFKPVYIVINITMHASFWILFMIDWLTFTEEVADPNVPEYVTVCQRMVIFICGFLYAVLSLSFGFYGFKFYRSFVKIRENFVMNHLHQKGVVTKLLSITILFTIFFLVRCVLVIISIFIPISSLYWWFDPVYYVTCDLLAIFLMFLVFRSQTSREKERRGSHSPDENSPINRNDSPGGWYSKGLTESASPR